jgi:serine/threonine protein kinase
LQRKIGEGAYGSVFLAEFNGYPVACKIIKSGINQENAKKILDELRMMRRLKHPNVVLLMGACLNSKNQIMIVTEFAARYSFLSCFPSSFRPSLTYFKYSYRPPVSLAASVSRFLPHPPSVLRSFEKLRSHLFSGEI